MRKIIKNSKELNKSLEWGGIGCVQKNGKTMSKQQQSFFM